MHLTPLALVILLPLASASAPTEKGLDYHAKQAGLLYFGSATDSPGQRERAGLQAAYARYDEIMWESGEFGQTTPTNGMKVSGGRSTLILGVDLAT